MSETPNQGPAALCLLANVSASDQPPDCELNLGPAGNLEYNVGGIKPEDAAASMAGSGESKDAPLATQDQGSSSAELMPVVVAQSVLVDGQLSGALESPRLDIAPTYQHQGVVVHGLRSLTVHTMSYGADGTAPGSIGGAPSQQQQQKDRLKEKQKKYRHRQGQLVRELGELLPAGSGMRSLNQILTAAVSQVRLLSLSATCVLPALSKSSGCI